MKQTIHDDQMIIRYLLNDLPAEDEVRFEEAYLRDGGFFEQVQSLEEELIENYVRGDLPEYERQRFEQHYLAAAPRRARVETARQLFQLCLSQSPAQSAIPDNNRSKLISSFSNLRQLLKQPLTPAFGVATALFLVLSAVLAIDELRLRGQLSAVSEERDALVRRIDEAEKQLAFDRGQLSDERRQSNALRERLGDVESRQDRLRPERPQSQTSEGQIVFLALAPGSRDITKQGKAVISSHTKFLELRVDVEMQETRSPSPYRVVLETVEGGVKIWTQEGIKPRQRGAHQYVVVRVPVDPFRAAGEQDFMLKLGIRMGEASYEELEYCYFQVTFK